MDDNVIDMHQWRQGDQSVSEKPPMSTGMVTVGNATTIKEPEHVATWVCGHGCAHVAVSVGMLAVDNHWYTATISLRLDDAEQLRDILTEVLEEPVS